MGKTYRNSRAYAHGCLRKPRGRKQAIINGARPGAVPPDPWDDILMDREISVPWAVANHLADEHGLSAEDIAHKLKRKFNMHYCDAIYIARSATYLYEHEWWLRWRKERLERKRQKRNENESIEEDPGEVGERGCGRRQIFHYKSPKR
jgi:hypothetical protein